MAMNGNVMGDAVAEAIIATSYGNDLSVAEQSIIHDRWRIICNEIVQHITSNAETTIEGEGVR